MLTKEAPIQVQGQDEGRCDGILMSSRENNCSQKKGDDPTPEACRLLVIKQF